MVKLSSFLVADSLESYCADYVDGENVEAVFDVPELEESLAFRQSIPPDLMSLIRGWVQGFCPLNAIEQALSNLIDERLFQPILNYLSMQHRTGTQQSDRRTWVKPGAACCN
jgi:hypothetical protein